MLVPRNTANFAKSLSALSEDASFSNMIFGLGYWRWRFPPFPFSADFRLCFCEALGTEHGGRFTKRAFLRDCSGCSGQSSGTADQSLFSGGYLDLWVCVVPDRKPRLFPDDEFLPLAKRRLPKGNSRLVWNLY